MKKVSILDVVEKSGVSLVTVSRVLNNSTTVREINRQKVLQAMKDLGYTPSSAARSLARGSTGLIGITLQTLGDTVFDGIIHAVNESLEAKGYFLALSIASPAQMDNSAVNHFLFQEDRVDGIILLSTFAEKEYVLELKRKKIPFVIIDNHIEDTKAITINVDNFLGGYEATKHLLNLGHTKIMHISGPELYLSARDRRRGYEQAMAEADLAPTVIMAEQFDIRCGFDSVKTCLEHGLKPTAVFAGEDGLALGAMDAFRDEGYHIPRDISIVGYDDQYFAKAIHPRLTTIRQPMEKLGQEAVRILLEMIDGSSKRSKSVCLTPALIVRESTAEWKEHT
ncbi:LacI family transcriptional regulator [Paenibacillus marchantiophytorum]|uniref:LacI family transcriptional regulator n=1 Tax=Paenibacillus marchantiophytorum TaxID=1619310 RepID=A0ABQ1FHA4_9BACL|nr:LacI family DNA-binding transcriptional regulator [Paenibacillus marchantiophytorum]GGA11826.1 LacI family transcriptional regulator [Paenibacillus marchantiophytorum]